MASYCCDVLQRQLSQPLGWQIHMLLFLEQQSIIPRGTPPDLMQTHWLPSVAIGRCDGAPSAPCCDKHQRNACMIQRTVGNGSWSVWRIPLRRCRMRWRKVRIPLRCACHRMQWMLQPDGIYQRIQSPRQYNEPRAGGALLSSMRTHIEDRQWHMHCMRVGIQFGLAQASHPPIPLIEMMPIIATRIWVDCAPTHLASQNMPGVLSPPCMPSH